MSTGDDWSNGEFPEDQAPDIDLSGGYADNKSVKQVDEDSKNECPPGTYTFLIRKVDCEMEDDPLTFLKKPKVIYQKYFIGDREGFFHYIPLKVALVVEGDPSKSVMDFFRTPPADPEEAEFYARGTKEANGHRAGAGWHWREYKNFLGHLGFEVQEDGTFPPEACSPRNWLRWPNGEPRRIVATVEKQAGEDKDGNATSRTGIKLFSYADSEHTTQMRNRTRGVAGTGEANGARGPGTPGHAGGPGSPDVPQGASSGFAAAQSLQAAHAGQVPQPASLTRAESDEFEI